VDAIGKSIPVHFFRFLRRAISAMADKDALTASSVSGKPLNVRLAVAYMSP